jgi:beta-N-acetylhexosaminidase
MRKLGYLWDRDPEAACSAARDTGFVMGSDLRACGIDVNLAPVLDVDYGQSHVIGDRAFHRNPQVIVELAGALIEGLKDTGIAPVGKHFPGHGFVAADSHAEVPVDERDYRAIEAADLVPFRQLIGRGLSGIMPAHVVFPKVDALAAGFSEVWLRQILRGTLGFEGVIFSDDLSMAGAAAAADDLVERARLALRAGCDVVLACNDSAAADVLLAGLRFDLTQDRAGPLERLCGGSNGSSMAQLHADARYLRALVSLARYATGDGMPPRSGST